MLFLKYYPPSHQPAQDAKYYLSRVFLVLPPFALGAGLLEVASNSIYAGLYEAAGLQGEGYDYVDPLSWDVVGMNVFAMALEAVAFIFLNISLEKGWAAKAISMYSR